MSVVRDNSDDEGLQMLLSAVERYKRNQKPERKTSSNKFGATKNQNQLPKEIKDNCQFLLGISDESGEKIKSSLREYEKQGAIPKGMYTSTGIHNLIKSDGVVVRGYSNEEKTKRNRERNRSHSRSVRSVSRGRQFDKKSVTTEKNSNLDKIIGNSNSNENDEGCEKILESFYYVVPEEPSPHFCLPPGTYYVVSKPLDNSIKTVVVCHPPTSKKDSLKNDSKTDKRNRESMELFIVKPEEVNDVNKSEQNCSNAIWARELISEYNAGYSKEEILAKMEAVMTGLKAEIERFQSALTESTVALDELKTLEFLLGNCKVSRDGEFSDKGVKIDEDFKGAEPYEENGAEVKTPPENHLVDKEDGEGGSDLVLVENSPKDEELQTGQEERTVNDPEVPADHDILVEEYSTERLQEDMMNNKIINIVSVLPDISENYLRTELKKIGDDVDLINIFINEHIENKNYPKTQVDADVNERKRLWKEYVTNFSPKKILFELSMISSKDGAASKGNDNDDIDLVLSFLIRRYPSQSVTNLRKDYEMSKNIDELCKMYDMTEEPIRLSESGFEEVKFNKEFLLKVVCLDYKEEIDNYLSKIEEIKEFEREEAELDNAFLQCIVCYDKIVPSETTTCSEGHVFCSNCVETYIRVEMGKGIYEFKCFSGACDASFAQKTLEELLPASVLMKISIKQQAEEVMRAKVDGLETCSFCEFAYIPNSDDKIFKCQNPECMAEICRNCHERSHIPLRCNEIERPKDVEARKKIEEVMTNALVRFCPNCKKKIVKIDGCNKMTCTCGASFCYLCGIRVYDYSHFGQKCTLHSNNAELHVRRVAEAGIQARDELLRADLGVQIVHDPTKDFHIDADRAISKRSYF